MVSYIKGGMQAKGIWKQDPEENIWAQEGWEWEGSNLYLEESFMDDFISTVLCLFNFTFVEFEN